MFTLAYKIKNTQEPEPEPGSTHTDYLEVKNAGTNEVNGYYMRTAGTLEQPLLFEMEGTEYKIQRSLNYNDENPACWYILKNDLSNVLYVTNNFSGNICPCNSSLNWFTFVDGGVEPIPNVNHVDQIPTSEEIPSSFYIVGTGNSDVDSHFTLMVGTPEEPKQYLNDNASIFVTIGNTIGNNDIPWIIMTSPGTVYYSIPQYSDIKYPWEYDSKEWIPEQQYVGDTYPIFLLEKDIETTILCNNAGTSGVNGAYKFVPKDEWSNNATLADIMSASYMNSAVSAWVNGPFALIDCQSEWPPNSGNYTRNVYIRGSKILQTMDPDKWGSRDVYNIYTANMVAIDADIVSITQWNKGNGEDPVPTLSNIKINN